MILSGLLILPTSDVTRVFLYLFEPGSPGMLLDFISFALLLCEVSIFMALWWAIDASLPELPVLRCQVCHVDLVQNADCARNAMLVSPVADLNI